MTLHKTGETNSLDGGIAAVHNASSRALGHRSRFYPYLRVTANINIEFNAQPIITTNSIKLRPARWQASSVGIRGVTDSYLAAFNFPCL
jgi:hypothetical protein